MCRIHCLALAALLALPGGALASSHREAPAIAQDAMADNTDVYAFISPNDPDRIVFVANSVPLLPPASGPNFYGFADDVAYEICIDNDGDALRDICYRWQFGSEIRSGETFLYNTGPVDSLEDSDLNVRQTYDLFRFDYGEEPPRVSTVDRNVPVAPWNVGSRSFPEGYERVAQLAINNAPGGETTFAGPRDEPFFVDLTVFDLLGAGGRVSSTDGLNVMSLVLEVPIEHVVADGVRPDAGDTGRASVIGVYARNLRRVLEIRSRFGPARQFGRFVQVSRLAVPLINEVVIPLQDKDSYNRTSPENDVASFGAYLMDPEVNGLLRSVLGLPCPPTPPGGRTDILGLLSPNGTEPADLLRINVTADQTYADSGFPNGRRLEDDVTDVLLTVLCSPDLSIPVGDGVDANDLPFLDEFPYLASPHSGNPGPGPQRPPQINSTPPTSATVDELYTYDCDASDPDGDPLTFSLDTAPAGMSVDPGTCSIEWTPTASQVGDSAVTVRVQDPGGLSDTQSFTLTVLPAENSAPSIVSTPVTFAMVGQLYTYDVEAIDPDGDTLTFGLDGGPAGMSIDPASGLIQWTPAPSQLGLTSAIVRVEDGNGGSATQAFTINVAPGG